MTSYRQRLEDGVYTVEGSLTITTSPDDDNGDDLYATRGAIEAASQYGIDITTVSGTGKDGRITKADVEAAAELAADDG
jgi:pyruvate/2-oxoglutarate dehydrogenase complex dihydrolipoamide acyltransferase (E2) component